MKRTRIFVGCGCLAAVLSCYGAARLAAQVSSGPVVPRAPVEPPLFEPPASMRPLTPPPAQLPAAQAAKHPAILTAPRTDAKLAAFESIASAGEPVLPRCVVKIVHQATVSVQEPGIITALDVREGQIVEAGAVVGRVSDGQARMAKLVAEAAQKIANDRATNDIGVRFAQSAARVAEFEYRAALQANERVSGAVQPIEVQRLALAYEKMQREIEQAQHQLTMYKEEAAAKAVEVQAAEDDIQRRQIAAPIRGEIVETPVHLGEWVKPGDAVFKIVQLDTLAVEGFLKASDYAPSEIVGRAVVVEAVLARGRVMQFHGKVVSSHPEIDARGQFRIKAEVANTIENGQYMLRPGQEVDMLIRLNSSEPPVVAPLQSQTLPSDALR